jgi:hypothetical protein
MKPINLTKKINQKFDSKLGFLEDNLKFHIWERLRTNLECKLILQLVLQLGTKLPNKGL